MKIQYCSDLHMEFHDNMHFMKSLPLEVVGDVLVIAGDVGYLVDTTIPHLRFWKWASENYRQVLMVAGNHEYYNNGDIAAQGESWQKMFLPNVGYYHNKVVRIDNVDFILSTLWSRIPPVDEFAIQNGMNDYAQILYNKRRLIPQNINDEFERNLAFIKQSVSESDAEKIVVVTHHLPTFAAIEDRVIHLMLIFSRTGSEGGSQHRRHTERICDCAAIAPPPCYRVLFAHKASKQKLSLLILM